MNNRKEKYFYYYNEVKKGMQEKNISFLCEPVFINLFFTFKGKIGRRDLLP